MCLLKRLEITVLQGFFFFFGAFFVVCGLLKRGGVIRDPIAFVYLRKEERGGLSVFLVATNIGCNTPSHQHFSFLAPPVALLSSLLFQSTKGEAFYPLSENATFRDNNIEKLGTGCRSPEGSKVQKKKSKKSKKSVYRGCSARPTHS